MYKRQWYGCEYRHPALHEAAPYGLPELFREAIAGAQVVGNPGCYPTSIALGLAPALRDGLVEAEGIVCDSKSGTTGAGRKTTQGTHFPECNEAFSAYKVAAHRHTPEIEQTLSKIAGRAATVTFVPVSYTHLDWYKRQSIYTIITQKLIFVNDFCDHRIQL